MRSKYVVVCRTPRLNGSMNAAPSALQIVESESGKSKCRLNDVLDRAKLFASCHAIQYASKIPIFAPGVIALCHCTTVSTPSFGFCKCDKPTPLVRLPYLDPGVLLGATSLHVLENAQVPPLLPRISCKGHRKQDRCDLSVPSIGLKDQTNLERLIS